MCRYYAHHHRCKHTTLTFAAFCDPASLIQNPCAEQQIWQTISVEEVCEDCRGPPAEQEVFVMGYAQGQGYGNGYGGNGYGYGGKQRERRRG